MTTRTDCVFVCHRCATPLDAADRLPPVGRSGVCSRCRCLTNEAYRKSVSGLRAVGTYRSFSLCMDIAVPEPFDVNGYYREIGVSPKATKAEIRDAILALPPSYRVAAIARLLLNRKRRAAYDAAPFGSVYVDELFTENLARMSLRHLDRHVRQVEDGALGWGHYLCGSGRSDYPSMWRALLLEALRGRSVTSISLGWQGPLSQELFRVVMVEGHPIVLIRETDEPTAEQAEAIAAQLIVPPLRST